MKKGVLFLESIKTIYDAPINVSYEPNGITKATLIYDDIEFTGTATLHPDDIDMESKIVGGTVAHMHAIIAALKHEKQKRKESEDYIVIRNALATAYKNLYKYLDNEGRAYQSIRAYRLGKTV